MISSSPHTPSPRIRRDFHRKRPSVSTIASTSGTSPVLPEYTAPRQNASNHIWNTSAQLAAVPFDQPPDYPDSANEADEETEDEPISPLFSPRRTRRHLRPASVSLARSQKLHNLPQASTSDTFLDSLLERSVHALELSNTLLQSSMSTHSSLSTVLNSDDVSDHMLDARARVLSRRIRSNSNVHERWMDDLDDLAEDIEELYDDRRAQVVDESPISRSLPSSRPAISHRARNRPSSVDLMQSDAGRLHAHAELRHIASPPPRAVTQYVNIVSEGGEVSESTSNSSSIFLPSTIGLRSGAHVSDFNPTRTPILSSSPPPSPYAALTSLRRANSSPSSSRPTHRISRPSSLRSNDTRRFRQRSRSSSRRSSTSNARIMPAPIEELPSQSDSSTESPHDVQKYRTVECLRKILDELPPPSQADEKEKTPVKIVAKSPGFSPRTPPVGPTTSTSTTTTSISRLFTKNRHSTSTRAPSPPRQSSMKQRLAPLSISSLSIPDMGTQSANSSGRSTPRNVAFGPLPESYSGSAPSKFKQKKEAKARARERHRKKAGGSAKEKEAESSWWTTWLTGGSALSLSSSRSEERAEDRMARSWGRPGFGGGMEDWSV